MSSDRARTGSSGCEGGGPPPAAGSLSRRRSGVWRGLLALALAPAVAWALRGGPGPFDGTPFEQPFLLPVIVAGVAVVVLVVLTVWARK